VGASVGRGRESGGHQRQSEFKKSDYCQKSSTSLRGIALGKKGKGKKYIKICDTKKEKEWECVSKWL